MSALALVNRLCEHYAHSDDMPASSVLWSTGGKLTLAVNADGSVRVAELEDALLALAIVTHLAVTLPPSGGGYLGTVMDIQRGAAEYLSVLDTET